MEIRVVKEKISTSDLKKLVGEGLDDILKAVVDIEKEIMAIGGELHSDANEPLIENGSKQDNLWGINIYPNKPREEIIEFSSLINIRPLSGNRSMEIQLPEIKEKIIKVVDKLIE